ncbi:MAG: radical SAM protein [Candidatus Omnitrophica bacterium]|nr:radical SAM protein [Candidatus Omnitrophota bacterium]
MIENLKEIIEKEFQFFPNNNQLTDLERLIYEIQHRENITLTDVINYLKNNPQISKFSGRNKFFILKESLIKRRFPITVQFQKIDTKTVYLPKLTKPLKDTWKISKKFTPLKIYIENEVKESSLAKNFLINFPNIEFEIITSYSDFVKKNKFTLSDFKKPFVFIIKEKADFFKPCPCTKYHIRCGYWILNLGFGCPFDCSYCFLQHYTNSPGLVFPANLEDFFAQFEKVLKNLKKPIRLGTGEFCDSLALDHITEYTKKLIPYFKNKDVFFELKTKSSNIKNLLELDGTKNIVISWSLNPKEIIEAEEIATASLEERLFAAKEIQKKGYSIGFHFDPIILFDNWQSLYEKLLEQLYKTLTPPFAWISLGTLRSNRKLKTIVEQRFENSKIFYGELLVGIDKKLRYPKFMRYDAYSKMINWIRKYDTKTPIYLCMEDKEMWQKLFKKDLFCVEKEVFNY